MRAITVPALLLCACFSDAPMVASSTDATGDSGTSDGAPAETGMPVGTTSAADDTAGTGGQTSDPTGDQTGATAGDGVVAECGNGVPEAGEDCDDANNDELDGCRADCTQGPRGIVLMPADPGPTIGPDGAMPEIATCAAGTGQGPHALAGLVGWRGGVDTQNAWTVSIGGGCVGWRLVDVDGQIEVEVGDDPQPLPSYGNETGQIDMWSLGCPRGAVPVGIEGRVFSGAPPNIVALRLACATPTLDVEAGAFQLTAAASPPWTASMATGAGEPSMCPAGAVAVGFRGDIDTGAAAIYRLAAQCATPTLVYGPG